MTRRRGINRGGLYCTSCGMTTLVLPVGLVTCSRCGHLGLRQYQRTPKRIGCSEPGCAWTGWDDGGVNDDLGRHQRSEHAPAKP